ncbi:hypothetical protein Rmf_23790 [Roseomonas fluvialis]|uniref:Uncharacterized protein n=2 Tax=Roseomonas fluvialis TaxID=1750527 RepID=A0ABN6P2C4_9PROT|nr:hypothetical protein Rmf_23790 [Roseomonas fluvialis]
MIGATIAGATRRVSLDADGGIEDMVDAATRFRDVTHIRVYSGVHGDPQGMIQIDDPDFTADDLEALAEEADGLTIDVRAMPMPDGPNDPIPEALKADLDDPAIFVILGWCYSANYLTFMSYEPPG